MSEYLNPQNVQPYYTEEQGKNGATKLKQLMSLINRGVTNPLRRGTPEFE